jgi:RNA polymerase sigma-70 factor (ECF subfamily)
VENSDNGKQVEGLVDHLFRRQAGKMVAVLTRNYGIQYLELAEDAVQDALLKALRIWPVKGIPENPSAWLLTVARNLAIDIFRRNARRRKNVLSAAIEQEVDRCERSRSIRESTWRELPDDTLCMLFACCLPTLSRLSAVALSLKAICGFSVREIAHALRLKEKTVELRLYRARQNLKLDKISLVLPSEGELLPRLDIVLEVLYLMYNEGYNSHFCSNMIQLDLLRESIRLAEELLEHPRLNRPEVHALLALFLFQGSHYPARTDRDGVLVPLEEQERSRWRRDWVEEGMRHFRLAMSGSDDSRYHVEAAIAACHCAAAEVRQTDWARVLELYDRLAERWPSPLVTLNRAVALEKVAGPAAALQSLSEIERKGVLSDYMLFHATISRFHANSGDFARAKVCLERALRLPASDPERRLLLRRLAALSR